MKQLIATIGMILVFGATGAAGAGAPDQAPAKATAAPKKKAQKPTKKVTPAQPAGKVTARISASTKKRFLGCDDAAQITTDPRKVSSSFALVKNRDGSLTCAQVN